MCVLRKPGTTSSFFQNNKNLVLHPPFASPIEHSPSSTTQTLQTSPITMATQTSKLFKYASRGGRTLSEHLRRHQRSSYIGAPGILVSRTFGTLPEDGFLTSARDDILLHPEPLPALAYAYDYDYDEGEEDSGSGIIANSDSYANILSRFDTKHDVTSHRSDFLLTSAAGGPPSNRGLPSSAPYPVPPSMVSGKGSHVGGGGTGRQRCPMCGATVTFRCGNEEHTYYCASCSGWFQVDRGAVLTAEGNKSDQSSPYEDFIGKNRPTKLGDPEILMRHVSTPYHAVAYMASLIAHALSALFTDTGAPSALRSWARSYSASTTNGDDGTTKRRHRCPIIPVCKTNTNSSRNSSGIK